MGHYFLAGMLSATGILFGAFGVAINPWAVGALLITIAALIIMSRRQADNYELAIADIKRRHPSTKTKTFEQLDLYDWKNDDWKSADEH